METESSTGSSNARRKKEKSATRAGRSKRQQYTLVACDECKKRKIRCNGEPSCARCTKLSIPCIYATKSRNHKFEESEEYKKMLANTTALQKQVNELVTSLNSLRESQRVPPITSSTSHTSHSASVSSTLHVRDTESLLETAVYTTRDGPIYQPLDMPASNLGAVSNEVLGFLPDNADAEAIITTRREMQAEIPKARPLGMHPTKEPLWGISKKEVIRLCYLYEEEIGSMYPLLYINATLLYAEQLYRFIEAALRTGLASLDKPGADTLLGEDTSILKAIVAIAMVMEDQGKSKLGMRLIQSLGLLEKETIKGMVLCVLVVLFHLQRGDTVMAWGLMSDTARAWFADGPSGYDNFLWSAISADASRGDYCQAINLSWSLYNLDRYLSSTLGRPFEIAVSDIESSMPMQDHLPFYFPKLVQYNKITSRIWELLQGSKPQYIRDNADEINRQGSHITTWYQNLPQSLQYFDLGSTKEDAPQSQSLHHHRVLLRLRHNHALMLISCSLYHAVVMRSSQHNHATQEKRTSAGKIARLAKDSIYIISNTSKHSNKYRKHQATFANFLVSAVAAILQVVLHAPDHLSVRCREAFELSLDLIRDLADGSRALRDLRKTIERCKAADPTLDPATHPQASIELEEEDAAMAMAELAGHATGGLKDNAADSWLDGKQIAYELDVVFSTADACGPTMNFDGVYKALVEIMNRIL